MYVACYLSIFEVPYSTVEYRRLPFSAVEIIRFCFALCVPQGLKQLAATAGTSSAAVQLTPEQLRETLGKNLRSDLIEKCKAAGISGCSNKRKEELIDLLVRKKPRLPPSVEPADDISTDMSVNDLFAETQRRTQVDAPSAPTCVCDAPLTPFRYKHVWAEGSGGAHCSRHAGVLILRCGQHGVEPPQYLTVGAFTRPGTHRCHVGR